LIPRTVGYLENLNPEQFSKVKKLVLTVWPLDPAVFSKPSDLFGSLHVLLKNPRRGGQRTYPNLLALSRFFLGNPEVL
jgi:hypothetical protein